MTHGITKKMRNDIPGIILNIELNNAESNNSTQNLECNIKYTIEGGSKAVLNTNLYVRKH